MSPMYKDKLSYSTIERGAPILYPIWIGLLPIVVREPSRREARLLTAPNVIGLLPGGMTDTD